VARLEIDRRVLAQNVTPDKVRALQLAPIALTETTELVVIEGSSIVIARAWVTEPDAWKQLPGGVRAGTIRRFDATQLQVADD
jgi:hypothetical protein